MSTNINRSFSDFSMNEQGIVQSSGSAYAQYAQNLAIRPTKSGIEKRLGYQTRTNGSVGFGMHTYRYINSDNTVTEEILAIGESLYRVKEGTFGVAYSGAQDSVTVDIAVSGGEYTITIDENGTDVVDESLGQGYEESSTVTLAALKTTIDLVSGLAVTITGDSTIAAAFLDETESLVITSGETENIVYHYLEEVNTTVNKPFSGITTNLNTDNLKNVNSVNHRNLLILTDGDTPKVYDGQTVYKAGLPKPTQVITSLNSGGALTGSYFYFVTYIFTDARGNRTESDFFDVAEVVASDTDTVLTIPTLYAGSGYNTNAAIVNGTQTLSPTSDLVTITVANSPHTLKAGDTAYLYNNDSDTDGYATYKVSSVTSTTVVVVSKVDIDVNDGDIISNDLKIAIYRATSASGTKYVLDEPANNPFVNSIVFTDAPRSATTFGHQTVNSAGDVGIINVVAGHDLIIDDIINIQGVSGTFVVVAVGTTTVSVRTSSPITIKDSSNLVRDDSSYASTLNPITTQGPPPKADYCVSYKGGLVLAKGLTIYWSDDRLPTHSNSSLSFPPSGFSELFPEEIKGLAVSSDSLIVFQDNRIDGVVSRALDVGPNNVYEISNRIGCVGHEAITDLGSATYFVDRSGIYTIVSGNLIREQSNIPFKISEPVLNRFSTDAEFAYKRCVAATTDQDNILLFTLPKERSSLPHYSTTGSETLAYDIKNNTWCVWTNFDLTGGVCRDSAGQMFFSSRLDTASLRRTVNRRFTKRRPTTYTDHVTPIEFIHESKWDILSAEAVGYNKHVDKLKMYSIRELSRDEEHNFTLTVDVYRDYVSKLKHSSLSYTFTDQGYAWGFRWNDKPVGSWATPHETLMLSMDEIEALRIRLYNNEETMNCPINGWAIEYSSRDDSLRN